MTENLHPSFLTQDRDVVSLKSYIDSIMQLCSMIKLDRFYHTVYGISRGGVIPAVWISHQADLKYIDDVSLITKKTLVVDDIVDSGKTISFLYKYLGFEPDVAVLYYKKESIIKPKYMIHVTNKWIVFPYEQQGGGIG